MQVTAGGTVVVELPGNPTTGYIWQVTANDESILLPTGYEFTPDSDATGAGGVEKFTFHAMAPGTVDLALAYSRPWETDTPPDETFAVTVEAVAEWAGGQRHRSLAGMEENGQTVAILRQCAGGRAGRRCRRSPGSWCRATPWSCRRWVTGSRRRMPTTPPRPASAAPSWACCRARPTSSSSSWRPMAAPPREYYALTVEVPATEPGSSGAVDATEAEAGQDFALVTGDTLVVRVAANPTTGYDWRVVSTNDALLPAAGEPVYAANSDLTGAGGVYTFRFLAKAAGEATVQIAEFAPGADQPDKTLDFNATIADPAPLTGNTVTATEAESGKPIELVAGDLLKMSIAGNPTTGYAWRVTANDGVLLRLLPESGFTADSELVGAPGVQDFIFRAWAPAKSTCRSASSPQALRNRTRPSTTQWLWRPMIRR